MPQAKSPAQQFIKPQSFFISHEKLLDLKALANSSPIANDSIHMSTHDAICAFIWHALIQARHQTGVIAPDTACHFTTAVDCRSKLKLPQPYFGNVIDAIKVSLPSRELTTKGTAGAGARVLCLAADIIRRAISAISGKSFRSLVGLVERMNETQPTRLAVLGDLTMTSVIVISWFALGALAGDLNTGRLVVN